MNPVRRILLLLFATTLALGQTAHQSEPTGLPSQPETVVRNLYHQVVIRHPIGLLYGDNMRIFAPYLSKSLFHRIEVTRACSRDWGRQNQGRIVKPPFSWGESGIFSGGDEKALPGDFQIERTQTEKDGSLRVGVRLTYRPSDGPGSWRVAAIVVREDGRLVVDDVIFLKDETRPGDVDWRLSQSLSAGCDGSRWVGYRGP